MRTEPPVPNPSHSPSTLGRALTLVHNGQATQRSELTDLLGLTRTATGTVLRELEALGLLRTETGSRGHSAGVTGRPSHRVEIHPDAPAALALQIETETLLIGEAGLGGRLGPVTEVSLPFPASPQAVLELAAEQLVSHLERSSRPCAGIGVALPSAVSNDGTALAAFNLSWPGAIPVSAILRRLLQERGRDLALRVGNDANLAALAEHRHGAGRQATDLLFLTTGQRGVGGGLVVGGRLHTGSAGYALEVGHLTVEPGGRACHCGNAGCLEVEADPAALLAAANQPISEPILAAAHAVIAAAATDASSRAAVHTITSRLGVGLASLVNVLNPDRVVLGGMHAELVAAAEPELRATLTRRSFLDQAARVDLRPAQLPHSSLTGAGELALQPLLDDPRAAAGAMAV